jgi:hypothetical protein
MMQPSAMKRAHEGDMESKEESAEDASTPKAQTRMYLPVRNGLSWMLQAPFRLVYT